MGGRESGRVRVEVGGRRGVASSSSHLVGEHISVVVMGRHAKPA